MKQNVSRIATPDVEAVVGGIGAQRRFFRRPWIWMLILAAIGVVAFAYWQYRAAPASPSGSLTYVTRPAEVATITLRVNGTGSVQPTNKVDISVSSLVSCANFVWITTLSSRQAMFLQYWIP